MKKKNIIVILFVQKNGNNLKEGNCRGGEFLQAFERSVTANFETKFLVYCITKFEPDRTLNVEHLNTSRFTSGRFLEHPINGEKVAPALISRP